MPRNNVPLAKDLVLGFAVGYAPALVSPFIKTLFGPGRFAGEATLFCKPGDRALKAYLRSLGVRCIDFHPEAFPVAHLFLALWPARLQRLRHNRKPGRASRR